MTDSGGPVGFSLFPSFAKDVILVGRDRGPRPPHAPHPPWFAANLPRAQARDIQETAAMPPMKLRRDTVIAPPLLWSMNMTFYPFTPAAVVFVLTGKIAVNAVISGF